MGANAVRKIGARFLVDILVDLVPVILVVPHALAVHANGQQGLQFLHICQRDFQIRHLTGQHALQFHHSLAHS